MDGTYFPILQKQEKSLFSQEKKQETPVVNKEKAQEPAETNNKQEEQSPVEKEGSTNDNSL